MGPSPIGLPAQPTIHLSASSGVSNTPDLSSKKSHCQAHAVCPSFLSVAMIRHCRVGGGPSLGRKGLIWLTGHSSSPKEARNPWQEFEPTPWRCVVRWLSASGLARYLPDTAQHHLPRDRAPDRGYALSTPISMEENPPPTKMMAGMPQWDSSLHGLPGQPSLQQTW